MSEPRPASRRAVPLWAVVLLGLACYWRAGYGYGTGDHEEILPQLLRALDPSLFPRDPYLLGEDDAFSVRFVFLGVLRALCVVLPPPVAVFGVSVAAWLGVSWAAARLALTLLAPPVARDSALTPAASQTAAVLAVLATVATVYWTPGGNALVSPTLVPESLAWTPALLAVDASARGRPYRSAAWLGATAWVQPLIGLQVGLLLGLVGLWRMADGDARAALGQALGFGALFVAVASPILIPTLLTQAGTTPPGVSSPRPGGDGLTTFTVTAWLRQAHHYLLSAQDALTLARFGLVVAAGLGGLAVLRARRVPLAHARFAVRTLAVIAALVVFYVAMTEGAESLTVAKMQFFRLTMLAKLMLLTWAAGAAVSLVPSRWRHAPLAAGRWGWSAALAAVALTVAMGMAGLGRPAAVWTPAEHAATDLFRAEDWIRRSTPRDALFLVPPSTTSFRSHALRSVAINFKPTTFRDDAMHVWLQRLRTVAPAPLPDRGGGRAAIRAWRDALDPAYHAHTTAEWAALANTFGADYALVDRSQTPTPPAGEPVFQAGVWAVYAL